MQPNTEQDAEEWPACALPLGVVSPVLFDSNADPIHRTRADFTAAFIQPLRLEIKRKLTARSERVKSVDFHPTEPWLLASLYNGNVYIWNYENQVLVKTFEVTDLPVRAAKFIPRKSWVITGSDDMQLRVFNYNTLEKVIAFEAHSDYIRSIAVHPTQPYVLTSSDDMLIKLWDWEKAWRNVMVFEGHTHYVMQVVFNPKDANTFASASLDRTIKVWSLGSAVPNYTLEGHEKGVNTVDYYHGGDKPYLVSGADDKLVKVWDYQNKSCVQTLEGHSQNVSVTCFHPELPIIITGSEDGTVRVWHSNTYRLENTLNYGMERVWAIAYLRGSNDVAIGYDEGTIAIKLGREEPAVSMDSGGKIIWAKHNEILTASVKSTAEETVKDGERMALSTKELGSCEVYPQTLVHSPNGRFVVVCGDGEYIIYTALAWRNKSFGSALEFVWAMDSNEYAVRESNSRIKVYKNFKEKNVQIKPAYSAEGIYGGALLGVRSSSFLNFYDWETGATVRRVEVAARQVYWSESDLVCIAGDESFYILKFNRVAYQQYLDRHGANSVTEEGVESAFEFVSEISETVKTGTWIGDCFIYTSTLNRLNYVVGGQVSTISHFDQNIYLLGYIPRDNRVYLCDKDLAVYSFSLPLSVIEYQTAILRNDLEMAEKLLPAVPEDQYNRIARFLEGQDLKELALAVSTDIEHRFELATQLGKLDVAVEIARQADKEDKWKALAETALAAWQFNLAEECLRRAKDMEGLLLFYQASGNRKGIMQLGEIAAAAGKNNISFLCSYVAGDLERCVDILVNTERLPEAAFFARTYLPSNVSPLVSLWKEDLQAQGKKKAAEALADPAEYENLFPDIKFALQAEDRYKAVRERGAPATDYLKLKDSLEWDLIQAVKENPGAATNGTSKPEPEEEEDLIDVGEEPAEEEEVAKTSPTSAGSGAGKTNGLQAARPPSTASPTTSVTNVSPVQQQTRPGAGSVAFSLPVSTSPASQHLSVVGDASEVDLLDNMSENMSHMSMEVNTTGTGSLKGDPDFDDLSSYAGTDAFSATGGEPADDDDLDKLLS